MRSLALAKAPEGEGNTLDDLSADGESEPDEELVILLDNDSVAVDSDVLEPDKEVLVDSEIDAEAQALVVALAIGVIVGG